MRECVHKLARRRNEHRSESYNLYFLFFTFLETPYQDNFKQCIFGAAFV